MPDKWGVCRFVCSWMRGQSPRRIVGGILTARQNGIVCFVRQRRTHFKECSKHVRRIATRGNVWDKAGCTTPPTTLPNGRVVARACGIPHAVDTRFASAPYTEITPERGARNTYKKKSPSLRNHPAMRRGYVRYSATRVNPRASARGYTSDDLRGLLSKRAYWREVHTSTFDILSKVGLQFGAATQRIQEQTSLQILLCRDVYTPHLPLLHNTKHPPAYHGWVLESYAVVSRFSGDDKAPEGSEGDWTTTGCPARGEGA